MRRNVKPTEALSIEEGVEKPKDDSYWMKVLDATEGRTTANVQITGSRFVPIEKQSVKYCIDEI